MPRTEPPARGTPVVPRRTKHDDVLAQLKAKPPRGGPKGADLDLICARHPTQPVVGTKRWPTVEQKGDCSSLTPTFPM